MNLSLLTQRRKLTIGAVAAAAAIFLSGTSIEWKLPFIGSVKLIFISICFIILLLSIWRYRGPLLQNKCFAGPFIFYLFAVGTASIFSLVPSVSLRHLLILILFTEIYIFIMITPAFIKLYLYSLVVVSIIGIIAAIILPVVYNEIIPLELGGIFKESTFRYGFFVNKEMRRQISVSAFYFTTPLIIYIWQTLPKRQLLKNLIFISLTIFLLAAASLTNSRVMFISAIGSGLGYILLLKGFKVQVKNSRLFVFLIMLFISGSTVITNSFFGTNIFTRLTLQNIYDRNTILARLRLIPEAYEIFRDRPIFGVGIRNYRFAEADKPVPSGTDLRKFSPVELYQFNKADHAHNALFTHLAESGLIGAIGLVALYAGCINADLKFFRRCKHYMAQKKLKKSEIDKIILFLGAVSSSWMFIFMDIIAGVRTVYDILIFYVIRGIASSVIVSFRYRRH